jgi:hypothetical protein
MILISLPTLSWWLVKKIFAIIINCCAELGFLVSDFEIGFVLSSVRVDNYDNI